MCQKLLETVFLVQMAVVRSPRKKTSIDKKAHLLRLHWSQAYMKYVFITDETRATLDGPDG